MNALLEMSYSVDTWIDGPMCFGAGFLDGMPAIDMSADDDDELEDDDLEDDDLEDDLEEGDDLGDDEIDEDLDEDDFDDDDDDFGDEDDDEMYLDGGPPRRFPHDLFIYDPFTID